jgi:hypothetical protein
VSAFPDLRIEPTVGRMFHGDDHIFVEVRMTGTQRSEFAGMASTGGSFETRVGCAAPCQSWSSGAKVQGRLQRRLGGAPPRVRHFVQPIRGHQSPAVACRTCQTLVPRVILAAQR